MLNQKYRSLSSISLLLLGLLFWSHSISAINPPSPICAEVLANGDVNLSWQQPSDPGNLFYSYVVYVIELGSGDPIQIGEVMDYNTTTFLHAGADAQNVSRTYLLSVKSGNVGQVESDFSEPIHTMLLEVTAGGQNALAFLSWNPPFDTLNNTSSGVYDVYLEETPGVWMLIGGSVYGNELFVDTVQGFCYDPADTINYRVELTDASGCTNVSSIDGDLLTDGTGPTPPVIETVSIDTVTGNVVICWYPSPQTDTDGYIIQDNTTDDQYITVGDTQDPDITCFTHGVLPGEAKRYLVIAYDECDNDESFGTAHETMYLQTQLFECDQEVYLNWTPYIGWENGVFLYEVYASENGGTFELIQSNSPENRQLTISVNPFSEYCFRIKAQSQGPQSPSYSNTECLEISYPQTPEYTYLNRVDVTPDNRVVVNMLPDDNAFQMQYRLERRPISDPEFEEIGVMGFEPLSGLYAFNDEDVSPEENRYFYRVAAYDFCTNFHSYSNVSSNVLLNAVENNEDYINNLNWNSYQLWDGGVNKYQIYRALGRDGAFEPIATLEGNATYFEDNVYDLINTHGEFCYYIEAQESINSFGRADTVRSNISCAVQKPLLWIPNAFVIGGHNDIFKPVAGYLDFDRYEMRIFNRLGQELFTSNDIEVGWNGNYKGSIVQEGAYIYVITFRAGNGQTIEEKGYVMLLNGFN